MEQVFATIGFRRLLSFEKNPPIQAVIDMNLVPKFLSFLKRFDQPKLQVSPNYTYNHYILLLV